MTLEDRSERKRSLCQEEKRYIHFQVLQVPNEDMEGGRRKKSWWLVGSLVVVKESLFIFGNFHQPLLYVFSNPFFRS